MAPIAIIVSIVAIWELAGPGDEVAILTYEASAERADGEPHHALVSTGYVKRDDGWKMMFHSQTPLNDKKAAEVRS